MYIEYACHDPDISDIEIKEQINNVLKFNSVNTISVLPSCIKLAHSLLSNKINIATPIDYPFGINNTETRLSMVSHAIKNEANIVDIMMPFHAVANRKYDKFRVDLQAILGICNPSGIKIRYTLEYRVFTYETLYKLTQILVSFGIYDILLSSGYRIDNIYDSILAGAMILKKNPKINIVYNCNIWTKTQVAQLLNAKPYGIRLHSPYSVELMNLG